MLVQRSSYAHSQLPRNNSQTGSRTRDQSSNNGARGTADQRSNNGTVKTRRGRIYTRHFCTVTAGNLGSGHRDRRCQMIRDTSEYLLSLAALLRKILSSLVRESIKIRSMHEITRQIILFWLLRVSILVSLNSSAFRHSLLQIHFFVNNFDLFDNLIIQRFSIRRGFEIFARIFLCFATFAQSYNSRSPLPGRLPHYEEIVELDFLAYLDLFFFTQLLPFLWQLGSRPRSVLLFKRTPLFKAIMYCKLLRMFLKKICILCIRFKFWTFLFLVIVFLI